MRIINWIYNNYKYTKVHRASAITIQKHIRGYIARKRIDKHLDALETKQRVVDTWDTITKTSKEIYALREHETCALNAQIMENKRYTLLNRTYQKERSNLVSKIADMDETMRRFDNEGEPLPKQVFVTHGLFIKGKKINIQEV